MTKRFEQAILIVTFLAFCWLAMQAVHELGHVVGAWVGPIMGSAVLLSWLVALQCRGTAGLQAVSNGGVPELSTALPSETFSDRSIGR